MATNMTETTRKNWNSMTTLPNALTFFRILVIPMVIGFFYVENELGPWISASCFLLACITDYLDGYFARALKQESALGTFLDPVADKLLVASTLLMLTGFGRISGFSLIPAVVILCREIMVSGLREFLAQDAIAMPVTPLAKWKTAIQMFSMGCLIIGDPFPDFIHLPIFATIALWLAATLTLITGYDYLQRGLRYIRSLK